MPQSLPTIYYTFCLFCTLEIVYSINYFCFSVFLFLSIDSMNFCLLQAYFQFGIGIGVGIGVQRERTFWRLFFWKLLMLLLIPNVRCFRFCYPLAHLRSVFIQSLVLLINLFYSILSQWLPGTKSNSWMALWKKDECPIWLGERVLESLLICGEFWVNCSVLLWNFRMFEKSIKFTR